MESRHLLFCRINNRSFQSLLFVLLLAYCTTLAAIPSQKIASKRTFASKFEYINGPLELSFDKSTDAALSELRAKGIKEHVCDILEGGLEAFHNRESRYLN